MGAHEDLPDGTPATASGDEAAVLAVNAAFYAAFNAHDLAAMEALWSSEAAITCVHPGWNVLCGRAAVLESWRAILGNPQQPKIVGTVEQTEVRGGMALVVGRELVGGSPIAVTNGFVRERAVWKLAHHHASPVASL